MMNHEVMGIISIAAKFCNGEFRMSRWNRVDGEGQVEQKPSHTIGDPSYLGLNASTRKHQLSGERCQR